jgi:hypothetical protein
LNYDTQITIHLLCQVLFIALTSPMTFVYYLAKANGALAFFEAHLLDLAQQDYYNISLH